MGKIGRWGRSPPVYKLRVCDFCNERYQPVGGRGYCCPSCREARDRAALLDHARIIEASRKQRWAAGMKLPSTTGKPDYRARGCLSCGKSFKPAGGRGYHCPVCRVIRNRATRLAKEVRWRSRKEAAAATVCDLSPQAVPVFSRRLTERIVAERVPMPVAVISNMAPPVRQVAAMRRCLGEDCGIMRMSKGAGDRFCPRCASRRDYYSQQYG